MRRALLALALLALLPAVAEARVDRRCAVAFDTPAGWAERLAQVRFATGRELEKEDRLPGGAPTGAVYALVWSQLDEQVVTLELTTQSLAVGDVFDDADFESLVRMARSLYATQIAAGAEGERRWRIRCKGIEAKPVPRPTAP